MVKKDFLKSAAGKIKRKYDRALAYVALTIMGITGCGFLAKNIEASDFVNMPQAALTWTPKPSRLVNITMADAAYIDDANFLKSQIDKMDAAAPHVIRQLLGFGTTFKILSNEPRYYGYNMFIDFAFPDTLYIMRSTIQNVRNGQRGELSFWKDIAHEAQHFAQIEGRMFNHFANMTQEESKIAFTFLELDAQVKGLMNFDLRKYRSVGARDRALRQQIDQFRDNIARIKRAERNRFGSAEGVGFVDDTRLLNFMRGAAVLGDPRIAGYSDAALAYVLAVIKAMDSGERSVARAQTVQATR
ncbi:MAG: hypothetical protein FWD15_01030 [Alphaproteobacteria bacterium]|nr:hypothetical protein [Alphaproteobacteria bacterium]